jgi:hypothetical protein
MCVKSRTGVNMKREEEITFSVLERFGVSPKYCRMALSLLKTGCYSKHAPNAHRTESVTSAGHGFGFYEEPFPIKRSEQHTSLFVTYRWVPLEARPCTLVLLEAHAHKKAVTVRADVIPSLEPHHRPLHLRTSHHLPPRLHLRAPLPCNRHQLRSAASLLLPCSCPLSPISLSSTRFFCCLQWRRVCNMPTHLTFVSLARVSWSFVV